MEQSLQELEGDVERSRARLLADLSLLSSPAALAGYKDDLRDEARSTFEGIVADVKGRAAANPAATLAIGAGLAWHLLRNPPIATAIIGAGLYGLWRTVPARPLDDDYFATAQTRLGEQMGDLATEVGDRTARMAGTLTESISNMAEAATEKVKDFGAEASEEIAGHAASISRRAASAFDDASRSMRAVPSTVSNAIANTDTRDSLLLGAAGLAVAAALGIAYQRRATEPSQRDHL